MLDYLLEDNMDTESRIFEEFVVELNKMEERERVYALLVLDAVNELSPTQQREHLETFIQFYMRHGAKIDFEETLKTACLLWDERNE